MSAGRQPAVFGIGTSAQSCAVGKKNSNNKSLNAQTIDSIKGIHDHAMLHGYIYCFIHRDPV